MNEMNSCYICFRKIKDFSDIKRKMKIKIKELDKKIEKEIINIEKGIKVLNKLGYSKQKLDSLLKSGNYDELELEIKNMYQDYIYSLEKFPLLLTKIFKENKSDIERINRNKEAIKKLKLEGEFKELKKEDFDILRKIIDDAIGKDRIKYNTTNLDENFVKVKGFLVGRDLPFSKGEETLIRFIFSLFIFVSEDEEYKNKYLLFDDLDDSFDKLNRVNISYVIKTFFYDYDVKFVLFTHNNFLIKEMWDGFIKNISLTLIYKDSKNERVIRSNVNGNIDFLGFKSGLKKFKDEVKNKFEELSNSNKVIVLIYSYWLLRIKFIVFNNKNTKGQKFDFENILGLAEYDENSDEKFFEKRFGMFMKEVETFFGITNKENFTFFWFKNEREKIRKTITELSLSPISDNLILQNNMVNLAKIYLIREEIRLFINRKTTLKREETYRNKLNSICKEGKIKIEYKNFFNYALWFLDSFFHNEISSSMLLSGIELDKTKIDEIINKTREILRDVGYEQ